MAVSPLATESYPAYEGNYSGPDARTNITEITIHHMAGVLSAESCGAIFQRPGRNGSSHYGIGLNGEIAWYVDENCVAWTNSNWPSNQRAITIENSNCSTGGDWPVSDATLNSLIKLVADIAKRNGLGKLVKGENLTWHSMYASTDCPGPYLLSKMDYIADEANKINGFGPEPAPAPTPVTKYKIGDVVKINGVYVSSMSSQKLNPLRNTGKITNIIPGARNPYLLDNGNLGWVNDDCIVSGSPAPAPAPAPSGNVKVGDKVTLKNWVDYNGTPLVKTRDFYFLYQLTGDRAVLTADYMGGPVYAAVKKSNLVKA